MVSQDVQNPKAAFTAHLTAIQARLYGYIHSLIPDINDAEYKVWTARKVTVKETLDEDNARGNVLTQHRTEDSHRVNDA